MRVGTMRREGEGRQRPLMNIREHMFLHLTVAQV